MWVPVKPPVFTSGAPIPFMEKLRWYVRTYKYAATNNANTPSPTDPSGPSQDRPDEFAPLRLCVDADSPDFGKIPARFVEDGASVLIVDADERPVDVKFLQMAAVNALEVSAFLMDRAPQTVQKREIVLQGMLSLLQDARRVHGMAREGN